MIGRTLRELREAKAWSQTHLAQAAGINARTVQRIEAGEPCAPETLLCIAAALGVDAETLQRDGPYAGDVRGRRASTSRWAMPLAAIACAPGFVFVAINLLKYGLGVPQPFDWFADAGALVMSFRTFDRLSPLLFVGGLATAILLCLADQARPRVRYEAGWLSITGIDLRLSAGGLLILFLSLGSAAALLAYAIGENLVRAG